MPLRISVWGARKRLLSWALSLTAKRRILWIGRVLDSGEWLIEKGNVANLSAKFINKLRKVCFFKKIFILYKSYGRFRVDGTARFWFVKWFIRRKNTMRLLVRIENRERLWIFC